MRWVWSSDGTWEPCVSWPFQSGVGNPFGGGGATVSALVDTGATYTILPATLLMGLGIAAMGRTILVFADGRREEYDIGEALIIIGRNEALCPAIFGPEGRYLLGVTALEIFGLLVNPVSERLEPIAGSGV